MRLSNRLITCLKSQINIINGVISQNNTSVYYTRSQLFRSINILRQSISIFITVKDIIFHEYSSSTSIRVALDEVTRTGEVEASTFQPRQNVWESGYYY